MRAAFGLISVTLIVACNFLAACDRTNAGPATPPSAASPAIDESEASHPIGRIYPDAVSVRMFVDDDTGSKASQIRKPEGVPLSEAQKNQLEAALLNMAAPEEMAACFIPHHFFRFYDASGTQVGEVAVCFCCTGVQADGKSGISLAPGRMLGMNAAAMARLVQELGARYDVGCD